MLSLAAFMIQASSVPRRNPHRLICALQRDGLVLFRPGYHVEFRPRDDPRLYASTFAFLIAYAMGEINSRCAASSPLQMCAVAALSARISAFGESPFGVLAILGGAVCFAIGATLRANLAHCPLCSPAGR